MLFRSSPSLFIGGHFSGTPSPTVCVISSGSWGTATNPFTYGAADQVNCFISTSVGTGNSATGTIYAGGVFTVTGIHSATNLAKRTRTLPWDTTGTPNFNNGIRALCYFNGYLVAGGDFTTPGTYIARYATTVEIDELEDNIIVNKIFPNPTIQDALLNVQTKSKLQQPELRILDASGKEIENHSSLNSFDPASHTVEFRIDREGLASGIYYYLVLDEERPVASGKLILE